MTDDKDKPPIVAYLYYEDAERALSWLSETFGFRERTSETIRAHGRVVHSAMDAGQGMFLLGSPGAQYQSPKRHGHASHNLYVYVDDIAAHYARSKRAGAKLLEELSDTFYGDRRYGAEDLEGQHWYFAQTIQQTAPQAWNPTDRDLKGHK